MELPERCGVPSPEILQLADPISRRREGSGDILAVCPGGFQLPQFILESAQLVLEAVAMAVERLGAISGHEMPDGIAGAAQRGVLEFRVLLYPAWSVGCEFVNALLVASGIRCKSASAGSDFMIRLCSGSDSFWLFIGLGRCHSAWP